MAHQTKQLSMHIHICSIYMLLCTFLGEIYLSNHCLVLGDYIGSIYLFEDFIVFSLPSSEIVLPVTIGT